MTDTINEPLPKFWVEKTLVKDRPDRNEGDHALGQALWSPQQRADGNDIYRLMRDVKEGDIIFHFVDNSELRGVSVAASRADDTFVGLPETEWAGRPAYRIQLRDYRDLNPPIKRTEFLEDPAYRERISNLLRGPGHGLFFNREFKLNQGSYLTSAPIGLVRLWDEIYRKHTGKALLPGLNLGGSEQSKRAPDTSARLNQKVVAVLESALKGAGLTLPEAKIVQFVSCLASKRFLVVTGLSGSGKSRLAQAVARCLVPARTANPFYSLVPVGADWTGNENVLGYPDGLDKERYVTKPALELFLHAAAEPDIPHFLILDEMNLSHVERYSADILSAIESDEAIPLHRDSKRAANGRVVPNQIAVPANVFIIGTVNVDETTYMFSPKVLDRANVIEFRMNADELAGFLSNPAKANVSKVDGKAVAFGKALVAATADSTDLPADAKDSYETEMLLFFRTLQPHGAEFGYRVAHEAARFMYFYRLLGGFSDADSAWFQKAFDCIVFQKLLPKLHGSRAKLGPVLKKMWFLCVTDAGSRGADVLKSAEDASRSTDKATEPSTDVPSSAPYPLSAEKIGRMWRLLNDNGFASFAEA